MMIDDIDARVEAARARLDAQVAAARAAHANLDVGLEELRNVSVTVRSPRNECEVTATAEGSITQVRVSPGAELGAGLDTALTRTIEAAQSAAREAAADRAAVLLGEGSSLVADLRARRAPAR
ncbi:YbaB/EbfC family nucleoid-associated protein [Microbacterium sp. 20-116]